MIDCCKKAVIVVGNNGTIAICNVGIEFFTFVSRGSLNIKFSLRN